MRSAVLLVAILDITIGLAGLVSPKDSLLSIRRDYLATPFGLYAVGAVYAGIGLLLILFAPASRAPRTLRALGAVTLVRGIAAPIAGVDRALAVLQFEEMQPTAVLRVGGVVALAIGAFLAFAVTVSRAGRSGAK
jgi:hypothetical protein